MDRFAARARATLPEGDVADLCRSMEEMEARRIGALEFMGRVRALTGRDPELLALLEPVLPSKFALLEEFEVRAEFDRLALEVAELTASLREVPELLRALGPEGIRDRLRRIEALRPAEHALRRAEVAGRGK
eukprot:tig00000681_g3105.t1